MHFRAWLDVGRVASPAQRGTIGPACQSAVKWQAVASAVARQKSLANNASRETKMSHPSDTTQVLAALIGLYFVAGGIALLTDSEAIMTMFRELLAQPLYALFGGLIAFAIGGAIVAVHNDWSGLLAGFVTLVGWVALAEGVLLIAMRRIFLDTVARLALSEGLLGIFGMATLGLGLILLYAGLVA